ncbi:MAG: hypothetical protein GXO73_02345 [Calditrichaeota bacterium]|nr:hypothetical protein [Calditrichota bacterium]
MHILDVPKPLREKLGDEGTEGLIEVLNQVSAAIRNEVVDTVSERFENRLTEEMAQIRVEMAQMRAELREEIASFRSEVHGALIKLGAELRQEMAQKHVETIRWMFIFWIGQVAVLVGLILALVRR